MLKNGTLVSFSSGGSTYTGFIVGICSYDNAGPPNAYAVRYIYNPEGDEPRKPYTIVDIERIQTVQNFTGDFTVAGHWSATPDDRCSEWKIEKKDGLLFVLPTEIKE